MAKALFAMIIFISSISFAKESTPNFKRDPASVAGTSEVAIQGELSWVKILGKSAKSLYNALAVPEKNNQGEAGDNIYFKTGKSYRCFTDKRSEEYACDIMIKDPKTGQIN